MAFRRCVCGCGGSLVEVRNNEDRFVEDRTNLVFQPAERSATFWIRTLVGTGEGFVVGLRGRGCAH